MQGDHGNERNPKTFFNFAKSRHKPFAQTGPFLDPNSRELNLDPVFSAECLICPMLISEEYLTKTTYYEIMGPFVKVNGMGSSI